MNTLLPGSDLAFAMGDVFRLWRAAFDEAIMASGAGVTPGEARALAFIVRSPGLKQTHLASLMQIEPMTVSGYIDRLERSGLARREIDPKDRRAKLIFANPTAADLFASIAPTVASVHDLVVNGLDSDRIDALRASLEHMRGNLSSRDER